MNYNELCKHLAYLPVEAKKQLVTVLEKLPPERRREILRRAAKRARKFAGTRKARWMLFGAIAGMIIEEVPLLGRLLRWPLWLALAGLAKGTLDDFEFERWEKRLETRYLDCPTSDGNGQ